MPNVTLCGGTQAALWYRIRWLTCIVVCTQVQPLSEFVHGLLRGSHKFKLGIGELLWRWTLVSTIPFQPYEPLTACFGEG